MGIIDNLRREARMLHRGGEQGHKDRIIQERVEHREKWEVGKEYFYESGVLGLIQGVIDANRAYEFYRDPEDFYDSLDKGFGKWSQWNVGNPYYYAELHLEEDRRYHETLIQGGHTERIRMKYIGIRTGFDGTISFHGSYLPRLGRATIPAVVKVPSSKWELDKSILDSVLMRVYHHPCVSIRDEVIGSPFFDRLDQLGGDLNALGQTMDEYRKSLK